MSGKITGYDSKIQNFIDTDLFDVSKHVTQTSGVLEVGVSYTILDYKTGDIFTNVGGANVTGTVFTATGTTPTDYSYGSTLAHYVTQSYTYAELKSELGLGSKVYKALLTQTGTNAPVATVLVNTLSGTPVWSYNSVGQYYLTLASEWAANKVIVTTGNPTFNSGTGTAFYCFRTSANVLVFDVPDGDDWLTGASVIIEVFP